MNWLDGNMIETFSMDIEAKSDIESNSTSDQKQKALRVGGTRHTYNNFSAIPADNDISIVFAKVVQCVLWRASGYSA